MNDKLTDIIDCVNVGRFILTAVYRDKSNFPLTDAFAFAHIKFGLKSEIILTR